MVEGLQMNTCGMLTWLWYRHGLKGRTGYFSNSIHYPPFFKTTD